MQDSLHKMSKEEFVNKHGERFIIYSNGIIVFMAGDEVDAMVDDKDKVEGFIPLFNGVFSIWSPVELYYLGEALQKLGKRHMTREDEDFISKGE